MHIRGDLNLYYYHIILNLGWSDVSLKSLPLRQNSEIVVRIGGINLYYNTLPKLGPYVIVFKFLEVHNECMVYGM